MTKTDYPELNALTRKFGGSKTCALQVLAFPSNQFGYQEPGENAYEIYNGLKYCRPGHDFVPLFPLLSKRDVNGAKEDSIFTFLKVGLSKYLKYFRSKRLLVSRLGVILLV